MLAEATDSILLTLIATLIGALIFVLKSTMKRGDDILATSQRLTSEALADLKRAVDTFADFRTESSALSSSLLTDLRSITATQERILEIQERILRDVRAALASNGQN